MNSTSSGGSKHKPLLAFHPEFKSNDFDFLSRDYLNSSRNSFPEKKRKFGFSSVTYWLVLSYVTCLCCLCFVYYHNCRILDLEKRVNILEETCVKSPKNDPGLVKKVSTQVFHGSDLQARLDKLVKEVLFL